MTTAVALQGGGVHGAYAWGVLDGLLAQGMAVHRLCGVSSGAILGTMYVQGHARGGVAGGRAAMRGLWRRVAEANELNPLRSGPLERWLFGWDVSNSFAWQGVEAAMRLFSPAQLNPFDLNPLRVIIDELLDPEALACAEAIPLTVGVTDVESGQAVLFGNAQITTEVLMASACLPLLFPAVRIGGRAYWDGGYSGNPPLAPLLAPTMPDALVLVCAQPTSRPGVPSSQAEILNRLNEIACQSVLRHELAALPAGLRLTCFEADAVLGRLPISSKLNADAGFIDELYGAGRHAAQAWAPAAVALSGMVQPAQQPRHSLSVRLLVLVVATIVVIDLAYFAMALRLQWRGWMHARLHEAALVVASAGPRPEASRLTALRKLVQVDAIEMVAPAVGRLMLGAAPAGAARVVDLDRVGWAEGLHEALMMLLPRPGVMLAVQGSAGAGMRLQVLVRQSALAAELDRFAWRYLLGAGVIAGLLGGLLFGAVRAMLVSPLLRVARSIAAFRLDPLSATSLAPAPRRNDEIMLVERELAVMQAELRMALWHNARLAAVGTAMAKMSHDLRGILSSALLVADRLTISHDDSARQAGDVVVRSVHRATALMQQTLDFVREGRVKLARERQMLRPLVDEAAAMLGAEARRACLVRNGVDAALAVDLDREAVLRVLSNLIRNAAQAGAQTITVRNEGSAVPPGLVQVRDDGPGLPAAALERLFQPFSQSGSGGSGLGLAIARDLMRAHGGDLLLETTGTTGTTFCLHFLQVRRE